MCKNVFAFVFAYLSAASSRVPCLLCLVVPEVIVLVNHLCNVSCINICCQTVLSCSWRLRLVPVRCPAMFRLPNPGELVTVMRQTLGPLAQMLTEP